MKKLFLIAMISTLTLTSTFGSNGSRPITPSAVEAGRGGTGQAVGDDIQSMWQNPAIIGNFTGFQFGLTLSVRYSRLVFTNDFNKSRYSRDGASLVPSLAVVYTLGSAKVRIAKKSGSDSLSKEKAQPDEFECDNCGKPVSASVSQCPHCAAKFADVPSFKPSSSTSGGGSLDYQCDNCGKPVSGTATQCPHCSAKFADVSGGGSGSQDFQCDNCNNPVSGTAARCPHCGLEFENATAPSVKKESINLPSTHSSGSSFFDPPQWKHEELPRWKVGLWIGAALGGGGEEKISSALFESVKSKSSLAVLTVAPTVSYRVNRWLTIGASFKYYSASLADSDGLQATGGTSEGIVKDFTQNPPQELGGVNIGLTYGELFDNFTGGSDSASAILDVDGASGSGVGGSIGIFLQPSKYFSIGISYNFEAHVGPLKGDATIDSNESLSAINDGGTTALVAGLFLDDLLPNPISSGLVAEYDFRVTHIYVPASFHIGIAFRPFDRVLFAFDFEWIGWEHAWKYFRANLTNGTNENINTITGSDSIESFTQYQWENQLVFKVGLAVTVLRDKKGNELILQLGFNHGTEQVDTFHMSSNSAPTMQSHLTTGAIMKFQNVSFIFSYVHAFTVNTNWTDNSTSEYRNTEQSANQDSFFFGINARW